MKVPASKIIIVEAEKYIGISTLLELAGKAGLKTLDVQVIQSPKEENRHVCICRCVATFRDGRVYSGVGDASPLSVRDLRRVPRMVSIAAMRSKITVLSDALSLDIRVYEDSAPMICTPMDKVSLLSEVEARASMPQMRLVRALAHRLNMDDQTLESLEGGLGRFEAADLIDKWKKKLEAAG